MGLLWMRDILKSRRWCTRYTRIELDDEGISIIGIVRIGSRARRPREIVTEIVQVISDRPIRRTSRLSIWTSCRCSKWSSDRIVRHHWSMDIELILWERSDSSCSIIRECRHTRSTIDRSLGEHRALYGLDASLYDDIASDPGSIFEDDDPIGTSLGGSADSCRDDEITTDDDERVNCCNRKIGRVYAIIVECR